jgi:subtilisin family serine protease
VKAEHTPTDPRWGGQWYFQNLGMPQAWGITRGDPSTSIAVVDTGCDLGHPDLDGKLDPGRDVVDGDDDPSFDPSFAGAAHGTACAGLVAAETDNDEGIAGGCPDCRIRCVRMLAGSRTPISADVEAFQFALEADVAVVSNSWGYVDPIPAPAPLAAAIDEVVTSGRGGRGAVVVFAAGNDDRELGDDEIEALPGVLCVGAINNFDDATPFTNRGRAIDVVAPTGTLTTDIRGGGGDDPGDYTSLFGGTSSACPVVAGIAGLLVSAAPELTGVELAQILIDTARVAPYAQPDAEGHDPIYGYGVVQPAAALEEALARVGAAGGGSGGGGSGGVSPDPGDDGGAPSSGGRPGGAADAATAGDDGCAAAGDRPSGAAAYVLALGLALGAARRGPRARAAARLTGTPSARGGAPSRCRPRARRRSPGRSPGSPRRRSA